MHAFAKNEGFTYKLEYSGQQPGASFHSIAKQEPSHLWSRRQ